MGNTQPHRVTIVGGGSGGLELATALGDRIGRKRLADITLIDKSRTHLWKPLLHEIAAGSLDPAMHELDFLAQAHRHHFRFRIGEMTGLDRDRKEVRLAPYRDEEGREVAPARAVRYDTLIIAVGSENNDFGTPGVRDYAISLDTPVDARRFHARLLHAYFRAHDQATPLTSGQLHIAVIGAGATGAELAAELHHTTHQLAAYGFDHIDPEKDISLDLIEAAPRILPALPERFSSAALDLLTKLRIHIHTSARVSEVTADGVKLANGEFIPAELVVWAAGVRAPQFLKDLAGLETNAARQLVVTATLQTTRDENIFAIGDCAACVWEGKGINVPPRAQAAHQQASHLARQIARRINGKQPEKWSYRDFGSLVSLGEYSAIGTLMGGITGGNLWIEGLFARIAYRTLYKMHELALHGPLKVMLDTLARSITRRTEPHVKLH